MPLLRSPVPQTHAPLTPKTHPTTSNNAGQGHTRHTHVLGPLEDQLHQVGLQRVRLQDGHRGRLGHQRRRELLGPRALGAAAAPARPLAHLRPAPEAEPDAPVVVARRRMAVAL